VVGGEVVAREVPVGDVVASGDGEGVLGLPVETVEGAPLIVDGAPGMVEGTPDGVEEGVAH